MPPLGPTDPGVTVATGNSAALQTAAVSHQILADTFERHSTLMSCTSDSLASVWEGESASAYHQISEEVVAHFKGAAGTASDAAATLRTFAHALDTGQAAGRKALSEAIHWAKWVDHWTKALAEAKKKLATAQTALTALDHIPDSPADAQAQATAQKQAASAVTTAQDAVNHAQQQLTEAETELASWQQKGEQALMDVELAAAVATGNLNSLTVTPPPWFGAPSSAKSTMDGAAPAWWESYVNDFAATAGTGSAMVSFKAMDEIPEKLAAELQHEGIATAVLGDIDRMGEDGILNEKWVGLMKTAFAKQGVELHEQTVETVEEAIDGKIPLPEALKPSVVAGALEALGLAADADTILRDPSTVNKVLAGINAAGVATKYAPKVAAKANGGDTPGETSAAGGAEADAGGISTGDAISMVGTKIAGITSAFMLGLSVGELVGGKPGPPEHTTSIAPNPPTPVPSPPAKPKPGTYIENGQIVIVEPNGKTVHVPEVTTCP